MDKTKQLLKGNGRYYLIWLNEIKSGKTGKLEQEKWITNNISQILRLIEILETIS